MAKIMVFIDGSWLYNNLHALSKIYGENYKLDYGKLPAVLGGIIADRLGRKDVDIVRTYLFGSIPKNYDLQDDYHVKNQKEFYDLLKEEYHYEVEIYPIEYLKRRLRKYDRDPNDKFTPKEKCVDIALATSMLYFAAIPYAYDIAVAVIGDRDFIPMLQHVRRLGKRVAIASIRESCAREYSDPKDVHRLKDFDIIWLGDHLGDLELKLERRRVECQSPFHVGAKIVYTSDLIRKGQKYYCDECKAKNRRHREEQATRNISPDPDHTTENEAFDTIDGIRCNGTIKAVIQDKGYGFITGRKGDYFFHFSELSGDTEFQELKVGDKVLFDADVDPDPSNTEKPSGTASNVQLVSEELE